MPQRLRRMGQEQMAALKEEVEVDKILTAGFIYHSEDCKMGEPNSSDTQEGWKVEILWGF